MNLKISIISNYITERNICELNELSAECQYAKIAHKDFSFSPETVMLIIELIQNIGYNAAYDLIKSAILLIISKIPTSPTKDTKIILINGEQKSEIYLSFEATEEQKDRLIDAAIEKWRT